MKNTYKNQETDNEGSNNYALIQQTEIALQQKYAAALIRAKPGLGDKAEKIAEDLVNVGLTPNESLMLVGLVYMPVDIQGRGQGTRLKYFAEALQERYGDHRLEKCGKSVALFRGLLAQINEAIEMRDLINGALDRRTSISFRDALRYQEIGLDADIFFGYVAKLTSDLNLNETAAVMKIRDASKRVENSKQIGSLEALLFPYEMQTFVREVMEGDLDGLVDELGEEYQR